MPAGKVSVTTNGPTLASGPLLVDLDVPVELGARHDLVEPDVPLVRVVGDVGLLEHEVGRGDLRLSGSLAALLGRPLLSARGPWTQFVEALLMWSLPIPRPTPGSSTTAAVGLAWYCSETFLSLSRLPSPDQVRLRPLEIGSSMGLRERSTTGHVDPVRRHRVFDAEVVRGGPRVVQDVHGPRERLVDVCQWS